MTSNGQSAADGVLTPRFVQTRFRVKPLHLADTKAVHDTCPVCKQASFEAVIALTTRQGARVLERAFCSACGHLAFCRMPSEEWFTALYRNDFETANTPPISPPTKEYAAIVDVLVPRMEARPARILDIGCGYGSALQNFRALGHTELYGLEPSDRRVRVARAAGFHVGHGSAETMLQNPVVMQGAPFDVIYSWHAFEHIFDVRQAMANVVQALRPGGLLFIAVPHFEAEHFVQMAHYLPHIHSFSNESLRTLMESNGLEIIYEDSSLRMIARKPEHGLAKPSAARSTGHLREGLRLKFIRDFGLRQHPELGSSDVCLQYSDYRGSREVLEPSFGTFQRLNDSWPTKLAAQIFTRLSKPGGTKKGLHHRLGKRWLGIKGGHSGPFVIGPAKVGLPPQQALPKLEFIYDDDAVSAWYK